MGFEDVPDALSRGRLELGCTERQGSEPTPGDRVARALLSKRATTRGYGVARRVALKQHPRPEIE